MNQIISPNMAKIDHRLHEKSAVRRILSRMPYVLCATWYPFGNQAQITNKDTLHVGVVSNHVLWSRVAGSMPRFSEWLGLRWLLCRTMRVMRTRRWLLDTARDVIEARRERKVSWGRGAPGRGFGGGETGHQGHLAGKGNLGHRARRKTPLRCE